MRNKRARVLVGDVERDVNLEPVTDDAVNAAVGAAYRRKVPFAAQLTGADGGVHGSRDHGTALPTD